LLIIVASISALLHSRPNKFEALDDLRDIASVPLLPSFIAALRGHLYELLDFGTAAADQGYVVVAVTPVVIALVK